MKWVCDWPEAKAQTFSLYQGETATFEPTFRVNGRTVTNATIEAVWYQTNGMGNAWWKLDGATFAPSNDVGAAAYRFFVEASIPQTLHSTLYTLHSKLYRANGALRMLPSPGFEPTAIEPPVRTLDFANIEVANAPWLLPEATNDFVRKSGDTMTGNLTIQNGADGEFKVWEKAPSGLLGGGKETSYRLGEIYNNQGGRGAVLKLPDLEDGTLARVEDIPGVTSNVVTKTYVKDLGISSEESDPSIGLTNGTIYVKGSSITPLTAETADFAPSSLASEVSALRDEIAPAVTAYPRVYAFMTGSTNASFSVTNYQLTAEADAERTHFDPADPDLDFSTVPSSLRLEDFSTGTNRVVVDTRDWTVWYYAQKIGGAIAEAVSTAVNTCRAWVNFTATGLENPVPDTLIVDVPNIWLMAGKTFEKHVAGSNACWVIRSKDTVMPISDNAQSAGGFLELTDAFGEPYIRFNKTESYFVDPQAEGITNTNGTWYIVFPTQTKPNGGANAAIEGSTTYPGKAVLKAEDDPDCPATITWTGGAGHWVMVAAPKLVGGVYPSKMFFGAVVEVQGQDYIEYLRPMSIPNLVVDGVKIAPQIPASHPAGTTISWKVVE